MPHQSHESWRNDLLTVDQLGLDGVDHYGLNLIKGTPLMLSVEKGKLTPVTRKELGAYYAAGHDTMCELGWEQISTSHWRNPLMRERSVYNFGAKTGWDFFGLGAGAGGSLNGISTYNTPPLEVFEKQVTSGSLTFMGMSCSSPLAPLLNALRAGMERARLDPRALIQGQRECGQPGMPVMQLIVPLLEQWAKAGLLEQHHRFYDLTLAGKFWQVQMTQRLTRLMTTYYLPTDTAASDSWSAAS